MTAAAYALSPREVLRSIDASRDTIGRRRMKLLDVVAHVDKLVSGAPCVVIGGLAQILWARKTHTDDLDLALATADLQEAYRRVRVRSAPPGWSLPRPLSRAHEQNEVFEVCHLTYRGSVVDLLAFKDSAFNAEILATARPVAELDHTPFIRPELLLVTQLLRPTPAAALAAVELLLARRAAGDFDMDYAAHWASALGRKQAFTRAVARAEDLASEAP
ncbi:MAG: hypothetical protein R3B70_23595 [Polyangiaceae bacterium]